MTTAPSRRLLVVDDEPDLRTLYELTLVREGYDVEAAGSVEEAWQALCEATFDAVITDMRLPDGTGLDLLQRLDLSGRSERTIVITAYGSAENAVEALKAGAYDYLTKPVDLKQFRAVVASATAHDRTQGAPTAVAALKPPETRQVPATVKDRVALHRLVGGSPAMAQVRSLIERVARGMAPVLIQGESGTGKELVARAIHLSSPRSAGAFVAVNCGAIPEALLEAEFFGYRKGAFTGATEDRGGFFQAAQGGTLFLDEIGDLPLAMQSKLLRVIQERAVRPIGHAMEVAVDARILSATHRDLGQEVQAGHFRQDLFYRLNVIRIVLPALRERMDDLPELCRAILQRISAEAGVSPAPQLTMAALAALQRYGFPGNVRELENLLHRALVLAATDTLDVEDLGLPQVDGVTAPVPAVPPALPEVAAGPGVEPLPKDLTAYLDGIERDVLLRALERHRYNRTAAGASLGLSLRQMRYRMARLGVLSQDAGEGEGPL
jgi:two-component system response regulator PilR (NtrC family)